MNALANEEFQIRYCEKLINNVNTNFWDEKFDQTTEAQRLRKFLKDRADSEDEE